MSELEALVASLKDQGLSTGKIGEVIKEYDAQNEANSFITGLTPNNAVAESTNRFNNAVVPVIDPKENSVQLDDSDLLNLGEKEEKTKFPNLSYNLDGSGFIDVDAEKKKKKAELKNLDVASIEYKEKEKELDVVYEKQKQSDFSTLDFKNVKEAIKDKDQKLGGGYIGLGEIGADVRENIKSFSKKGPAGYSKMDIYDKAIENMKVDNVNAGAGKFKDKVLDTSEFEDWELLDGLSFQDIQKYAGIKYDVGASQGVFEMDAIKKTQHLENLRLKKYRSDNEVINEKYDDVVNNNKNLKVQSESILEKGDGLQVKVEEFNTRFTPINEKYTKVSKEIETKNAEVERLKGEFEKIPRPTTKGLYANPAHISFYNKAAQAYQASATDFNSYLQQNKTLFDDFEGLIEENKSLQAESNAYNEELGAFNSARDRMNTELGELDSERTASQNKYGLMVADGILKFDPKKDKSANLKEYENWRKKNKITHSFLDKDTYLNFAQGLGQTAMKYYTGTQLFAFNAVDAVTGGSLSRGDEYTALDYMEDAYDHYGGYDLFGIAKDEDYEEGELGGINRISKVVAEGLPFMIAISRGSGAKAGMLNKVLPNFTKTASNINLTLTGFQLSAYDNVVEGRRMGLTRNQATAYGGVVGSAIGLAQMIVPDSKLLQGSGLSDLGKKGISDIFKRGLTKNATSYAIKNYFARNLGEIVEEEVEFGMESLAKNAFNLQHENGFLDWKNHQRLIKDTFTLTGTTGLVGARSDIKNYNGFRNNAFKQLRGDVNPMLNQINEQAGLIQEKISKAEEIGDKIAIDAYTEMKTDLLKSKEYVTNFKNALNIAPENVTDEQLEDLTTKMSLLEKKKNLDPAFQGDINEEIKAINEKIEKSVVEKRQKETNKKTYESSLATVKKLAEQNGSKVQEFKSDKEVNEYLKDNGIKSRFDGGTYGGFVDVNGVKTLVINKAASQSGEGVNAASHEFLHQVLQTTFAKKDADGNPILDENGDMVIDKKAAIGIGQSLGQWLSETEGEGFSDSKLMERLRTAYSGEMNNVQAQEVLNLLSDSIVTGDLKFEENMFTKLGDVMRRGLQSAGIIDVKFNTAKDVYNFVKDYNKSIASGGLNKAQKKLINKGAKIGGEIAQAIDSELVNQLAQKDSIEERRNILAEQGIDPDSNDGKALLSSKASDVAGLLDKFDGPRDMISKSLMETKDGQQVMDLKNRSGDYVDNPFVRSEFGQEIAPITETIAKRLFDPIPQNLRAGITRGQFMNELTSMAAGLVENEYDASKQDIDKFISNRLNLRANKLASDLGIESTVEEGGLGASVSLDAAAELSAPSPGTIDENTPTSVLVDRLASTEQKENIQKTIKSKIKGTAIEVEPGKFTDISKLNYKTLKNLVAPEVANLFGIKAVDNYTSKTKTLKNDDVIRARMFIGKNADIIYNSLPKGVTASGTATGLKQVISKNFYTKSDTRVKYDAKEGGAGIFPQVKNKMTGKEFAAVFGYEKGKLTNVKGQNPATLISGLMDEVGKTITNQVVRQELDNMTNAADKDVAARIALLGDGKSDVMFSQASLSKLDPESHIAFLDKTVKITPSLINAQDGNMTNVLKIQFDKDIKNDTYRVGKQSTEKLIEKVGKSLQSVYDAMTQDRALPADFVYDGNTISDMVFDQFLVDNVEDDFKNYKAIAGNVKSINDPEVGKSARKAIQILGQVDGITDDIKEAIAQGIGSQSKYADGKHKFKLGELEYEAVIVRKKDGSIDNSPNNRFGLANNISDARALLGINKPAPRKGEGGIRAYEPPKTGKGLPTEANMTRVVAEGQKANKDFRVVTKALKDLYGKGQISKNDVVAILQSFNGNPRGLTRMAAVLDWLPTKKWIKENKYLGQYRLEHMTPALRVNLHATSYILNNDKQAEKDFNDIMDGYKIAYLPIKFDDMVNEFFKSAPPTYVGPDAPSINRYKNLNIPGFDLPMRQLSTNQTVGEGYVFNKKQQAELRKSNSNAIKGNKLYFSKASDSSAEINRKNTIVDRAIKQARLVTDPKGISVLDFDDTLATTESLVKYTKPDGTTGTLNAEQYAKTYEDLLDKGYVFDFSDFNKVVKGKLAPLFQKALKLQGKFGSENMFVLTARPPAAQKAIFDFLKANGLNIPVKNITGLGNSTSEAKALWVADKVGDGYNDFYFADDALQNVQAVDNMLEQFDVKRKVQQAKLNLFSKASDDFNQILEDTSGVNRFAEFSDAKAQKRGSGKGKYNIFIPSSAEDFKGLLYKFLGKGAKGEAHMKFFTDALINPFSRAIRELDSSKSRISSDYKALIKMLPDAKKLLNKTIPEGDFTYDTAVRVYNWTQQGIEIKGLSKSDKANLLKAVENNPSLLAMAQGLDTITKGYPEPGDYWMTETILSDLNNMTEGLSRKDALAEFIQNREEIFGKWDNGKLVGANMNKIEAIHGTLFREALTDMLWRMENGTNRAFGSNRLTNRFANWVNNSVGAIMFFNMRSAALQTLSTVNFINWSDNNILSAGKAFANQKQYWKDFTELFNSDMLQQRRSGLRSSVSHAELAEAASGSKGSPKAVFQYMLKLGFLPTQIADSFAIAAGGATFYRNRINSLMKNGMSEAEAKKQAFNDFQNIAEETQQSSRPDMISSQQASPLGRLVLAFQNTPMQYTRLTKKAILDLVNGRGDVKTNVSKILYYGAAQNLIFSALQKAMFAAMFDDEEDEDAKKRQEKKEKSLLNSILDSTLRGMGVGGAVVSTLKNMIIRFLEEDKKGWNADFDKVIVDFLNLSPPVGSKVRKLKSGFSTYQFNKEVIDYMPKNDIDNPMWETVGNVVSAVTNVPMDRLVNKTNNVREAFNSQNETWQRIALLMGWNRWDIGVEKTKIKEVKAEIKEIKKVKKKEKDKLKKEAKKKEKERLRKEQEAREVQCSAKIRKGKGPRCKNKTENKSGKCYAHQ